MPYGNYTIWLRERILGNSTPNANGCLEYGGGKLAHKYGLVSVTFNGNRKLVPAHRALYMAVNGCLDLPSSVYIRHKCDNPCCVNIEHLESGSAADNSRDCIERGRRSKEHAYATRLRVHSEETVAAIRAAEGKHKHIAEAHGVSVGYVSKIKSGKLKRG